MLPEARSDETRIPQGVEVLLEDAEIKGRIAYIRAHYPGNGSEDAAELRRLVNEESHRELLRLGVIQPGTPR